MSKTREDSAEYTCNLYNTPTLEQLNQKRFSEMTLVVFFSLSTTVPVLKCQKVWGFFLQYFTKTGPLQIPLLTEVIKKHTFFQIFFLMLKKYIFSVKNYEGTIYPYIPNPPRKTSKLKEFFQPSKENIQHFLNFFLFVGNFCPPRSGSAFPMRIRRQLTLSFKYLHTWIRA